MFFVTEYYINAKGNFIKPVLFFWDCFGKDAVMASHSYKPVSGDTKPNSSTDCVYDAITDIIYILEYWDHDNHRMFRWVNPDYLDAYKAKHEDLCIAFLDTYVNNGDDSPNFEYEDISYREIMNMIQS